MLNKFIKIYFITVLFSFTVYSQSNDSLKIGYCYINSIPQESHVFLNGTQIGDTPLYFVLNTDSLKPNSEIVIKQLGYADYVIKIEDNARINRTIMMIQVKPGLVKLNPVIKNKSQVFVTPRKLAPVIISSALTAGGGIMSYYFKKLANDNYDYFNNTGDQSALDRKKKYDVISGISLAVFQVGFAGLIYFLLIDK